MSIDKSEQPVGNEVTHNSADFPYILNICAPFPGMENPPTEEQLQGIREACEFLRSLNGDT